MSSEQIPKLAKGIAAFKETPLPEDYVLGEYDVICGRGSTCFNHIGNRRFRKLVVSYIDEYSNAKNKLVKNRLLCEIVQYVRSKSPDGGFVKKNRQTGCFVEVGDFQAREKTSQAIRDALYDKYKSSNAVKRKRRLLKKCTSGSDLLQQPSSDAPYASEAILINESEGDVMTTSCITLCKDGVDEKYERFSEGKSQHDIKSTSSLVSIGSSNKSILDRSSVVAGQQNWNAYDTAMSSTQKPQPASNLIDISSNETRNNFSHSRYANVSNNAYGMKSSAETRAGTNQNYTDQEPRFDKLMSQVQSYRSENRALNAYESMRVNYQRDVSHYSSNHQSRSECMSSFDNTNQNGFNSTTARISDLKRSEALLQTARSMMLSAVPESRHSTTMPKSLSAMNNLNYNQYNEINRLENSTFSPSFQRDNEDAATTLRRSSLAFSTLFQATFNASLYGSNFFEGELDVSSSSRHFSELKEPKTTISGADLRLRFKADSALSRTFID